MNSQTEIYSNLSFKFTNIVAKFKHFKGRKRALGESWGRIEVGDPLKGLLDEADMALGSDSISKQDARSVVELRAKIEKQLNEYNKACLYFTKGNK